MPFSDYEMQSELDRDGDRVAYLARHLPTGRMVRFEVYHCPWSPCGERHRDVYQEAALLNHPGVLPIVEMGRHESFLYLVRPDVGGEFLDQTIRRGRVAPALAARWVEQVAHAVQHAHDHGVFPRDLTPASVLLGEDGAPRLSSFDHARVRFLHPRPPALHAEGAIVGRPAFMAPEQVMGKEEEHAPAAAVWGLGALLYTLLTAQSPFQGAAPIVTLLAVINDPPPSPRAVAPDVSRSLDAVCRKCLQKKPADRYPTAAAAAEDLHRCTHGEPVAAEALARHGLGGWMRRWWGRPREVTNPAPRRTRRLAFARRTAPGR